jgi:N-sulfoglucosamine sulfohydrolase
MIKLLDAGLIPEGMYSHLAGEQTIYDYVQSDAYPIERVIDIAYAATSRDERRLDALSEAMNDDHPVIRYWGATGCLVLKEKAADARAKLLSLMNDPLADVRVVAAEAIAHLGKTERSLECLTEVLAEGNPYEALAAQNAVEYLWADDVISIEQARAAVNVREKWDEPLNRIPEFLNRADDADRPRR